ncbi:MAG: NAD-dependent epimerase/dehydratase family protein [Planctomycetota bacterium]
MRIFVTGVAGFIGSNLADRLCSLDSCHVIGIDNLAYGVREQVPNAVEFHKLDIRSREIFPLFDGMDIVFHLAAKNCISDCQLDPVETADINVTGTVNVFEAARRAGVKKVIYAESSALYEGSDVFPTPESQVKPESFYAASKAASTYFANSFERFSNLRFTALRYFCVYGPRQDYRRTIPPVMSAFIIKLLKREQPVIYGSGNKKRDFVYVDDVNDFHLRCINDTKTDGQTFNIGSGRNYSVNEIYQMITDLIGIRIPVVHKPDLPGEAEQTLADITNARRLGWTPKTPIADGLKKMVDFIKSEFQKGNIK